MKICNIPECNYPVGECIGTCYHPDEKRIDIIGQNGGDGEHYNEASLIQEGLKIMEKAICGNDWHGKYDAEDWSEPKQATPHKQLIRELLDSTIPKTEREHAAVREIFRLADTVETLLEGLIVSENVLAFAYGGDRLNISNALFVARKAIAKAREQS